MFFFTKLAVLSHFKIGGFVPLYNRRFCLIFEIGDFVSFSKSAVLSHLKSAVLSCPQLIEFIDVLTYWWCQNNMPQVKVFTGNYNEQKKNSREAEKIGHTRRYPTKFWGLRHKIVIHLAKFSTQAFVLHHTKISTL